MSKDIPFTTNLNQTRNLTLNEYLFGEKLYGDDFTINEIIRWYDDEKEGYINLISGHEYIYNYHALNRFYGFRYLPTRLYEHVLGLGSAFGEEFKPISKFIRHITIIEINEKFVKNEIFGIPCKYLKPNINGELPFRNNVFDLITSFGVLHHIPNVSFIFKELFRCLKPSGFLLLREPIVSMGDWNKPRKGLTKRERYSYKNF